MNKRRNDELPFIEITGPIDIGKKYVAQLVARQLGGIYIPFPKLIPDPSSLYPISTSLLKVLTTNPQLLEDNPEWWAHTYLAGLYEYKTYLNSVVNKKPLITTNYTNSFRVWMKAAGLDTAHFMKGMTVNLPKPNSVYCVTGTPWSQPSGNLKIDFSPEFVLRVNKAINATCNKSATKIVIDDNGHKFRHVAMNKCVEKITDDLKETFKDLVVNTFEQYTSKYFLPKKYL